MLQTTGTITGFCIALKNMKSVEEENSGDKKKKEEEDDTEIEETEKEDLEKDSTL